MKRNQGITGKIKELILKRKTDLKEGLIIDNSNLCIMFFLIDWLLVIMWRRGEKVGGGGGSFEIGRPTSRGWNIFGRRWTRGVGS